MYISKFTPEKKRELLLLFKQGIPIKIIAVLFEVSIGAVIDKLPSEAKADAQDFKIPTNEKRLELLKIYAWLVADETDCAAGMGAPIITKAKPALFEYLRLKEWVRFLEGVVAHANFARQNRFHESVSVGHRRLIDAVLPPPLITITGKDLLEIVLSEMHIEKAAFPSVETITKPALALSKFVQKYFALTETFARYFDQTFISHLDALINSISNREAEFIKAEYNLSDTTRCQLLEKYDISTERGHQYKRRGLRIVYYRLKSIVENPLSQSIIQKETIRKSEQELREAISELIGLRKTSTHSISKLQEKVDILCKYFPNELVQGQIPAVQKILKEYENGKPPIESSVERALKTPLEDLDLSVRAFNCIKGIKISSLRELVQYDAEELIKFRNFGQKSIGEIEQVLNEMGLSFGMAI